MNLKNQRPLVIGLIISLLQANTSIAAINPSAVSQSFTYQGRLFKTTGEPLTDKLKLMTVGIYNPAGDCLLYEQSFADIELDKTDGVFGVSIGSAPGNPARTVSNDPGYDMYKVFSNNPNVLTIPPA